MKLAQQLYEKGYITYMRTDSPNISQDAIFKIKEYIISTYGETFSHIRQFKSNNQNAQEAHECIRPSNIDVLSENISDVMDDAIKLYKLIWEKTIASQMSENIMKVMDVHIELVIDDATLKKYDISNLFKSPTFIGSIKKVSYIGYKIIYQEDGEEDETNDDNTTIDFNQNYVCETDFSNSIKLLEMNSSEQLNSSKPLYNEPSIIKTLEKYSIGRPSTYAALLKKIKDYNYVEISNVEGFEKRLTDIKFNNKLKVKTIICKEKVSNVGFEKQKLVATDLGKRLVLYLNKYFPHMMDYKFTSNMELKLDQIANGSLDHKIFIKEFYDNLVIWLSNKETN
jgi:DNA topoisomerase-1